MSAPTGAPAPAVSAVRPRKVLTTVLVVLALATTGVVAVGALAYCSVFGCTFFSEDFEPNGPTATAARADAVGEVRALADELVAGREVLATATADGCIRGFNDWKRKDTYSHECSVVDSRLVLVAAERDAVADGLTAADAALGEAGCSPTYPGSGLDRVRDEYWNDANPQVRRLGAAGLPGATYSCPGGLAVDVAPTSAQEREGARPLSSDPVFLDEVIHEDWFTPADVTALRQSGAELALLVTAKSTYYRTRF
jgi:hypothetical protein